MKYVHIAGTNGKGSVAEYISEIIIASGNSCACFTSPHLVSPCERLRIDGKCIEENELNNLLIEVKEKSLASNDSLFASYTAAALLWFSRMGTEFAVIETGLGGRLDPTNCIKPDVVILTPIDYDHINLLGERLGQIAKEKCGIIKRGVPVVSAKQHKEARQVIVSKCKNTESSLMFADEINILLSSLDGQKFRFDNNDYSIRSIGKYQPENAALAILAAKTLGFGGKAISSGLRNTRLKCRTQYFSADPNMIIDGAHNSASIEMLMNTLKKHFKNIKKVLLFACMKDKDYKTMISKLGSSFSGVIVTRVDENRGESPKTLSKYFSRYTNCTIEEDSSKAFHEAKDAAKIEGALLIVCGSFYLAGAVSGFLEPKISGNQ